MINQRLKIYMKRKIQITLYIAAIQICLAKEPL